MQLLDRLRERVLNVGRVGGLDFPREQVGSTAVPGLAATLIIDVGGLVAETAQRDTARAVLTRLGYEAEGDRGIVAREAFRAPVGDPAHHLYLLGASHPQAMAHLAFRDYWRTHPETHRAVPFGPVLACVTGWPRIPAWWDRGGSDPGSACPVGSQVLRSKYVVARPVPRVGDNLQTQAGKGSRERGPEPFGTHAPRRTARATP